MKKLLGLIIVFAMILTLNTCNQAKGPGGLFINLHTDNYKYAMHAFHFAGKQLEKGHPVVVFLNGSATDIAVETSEYAIKEMNGKTPYKMLEHQMSKGLKVIVCQYCMKMHKIEKSALIKGAEVGNPDLVGKYLYDPSYKVISW